jgi:hypothetical protein
MKDDTQQALFDKGEWWDEHWQGMPEFDQPPKEPFAIIVVRFRNQEDLDDFAQKIGQKLNRNSQSTWHPELKNGELGNSLSRRYVDES